MKEKTFVYFEDIYIHEQNNKTRIFQNAQQNMHKQFQQLQITIRQYDSS